MWTYLKWTIRILLLAVVVAFLHYTLPHRDVVRITNTYNRLTEVGANWMFYASPDSGTGQNNLRDIRFIEAFQTNNRPIVYRNEDTGWIWPPYFKYNSANLQAQAANLRSTAQDPQWVVVTHYGWRIPIMSIYPNAVRVRPVAGPDVQIFPWVNIVILALLALIALLFWRMWRQFRRRVIDPVFRRADARWDQVEARAEEAGERGRAARGRFGVWLDRLMGRQGG